MEFLWVCKYSIGSSKVRICTFLSWFIISIRLAKVVDFPLPVGPVTNIKPLVNWVKSLRVSGRFNSLRVGIPVGINLKAIA